MTQSIKTYNIANNSIKSFNFDSGINSSITAASYANTNAQAASSVAQSANTLIQTQSLTLANVAPTINVISICDSSYNVLDDTAANTTGAYLQITGSGFQSGAVVMVGSTNTATSTTLVNSNTLRAQIGSISTGTYPVYVINSNGGTAIKINGLTTSSFPAWGTGTTLANTISGTAFSVSLSANSDSNITYSNTTVLPTGTSLLSNGYFYGTVTVGSDTTYSFTVDARDAENQDALRTFSVTIKLGTLPGLWSWGYNLSGQGGTNDKVNRSSPVQVGTSTDWSQVTSDGYVGASIKTNGTLWTWGRNFTGALGTNDSAYRSSPAQVGALTNWSYISAVYPQTIIATKTDGTLWSIGYNIRGQLGLSDAVNRSSPVQVGALTNWSKILGGGNDCFAVKTDGTLWAWGANSEGVLGTNDTIYRSSPVQIGTDTNWSINNTKSSVFYGYNVSFIKTNGTMWTWGRNAHGQLGFNDTIRRSSPVQLGAGTTWLSAAVINYAVVATKTDGTLWAWGRNDFGQLGKNDVVHRSSPIQVGTSTDWSTVSGLGINSVSVLKTDGTLWVWGQNDSGQLGQNDLIHRSSPVQLGTYTNWSLSKVTRPGDGTVLIII